MNWMDWLCRLREMTGRRRACATRGSRQFGVLIGALLAFPALASPVAAPGDSLLRHDIQLLADAGILSGPVTTWPVGWGTVLEQLAEVDELTASMPLRSAILRLKRRAAWESRRNEWVIGTRVYAADGPQRIRGFHDTPRETVEIAGSFAWNGDRFAVSLQPAVVDRAEGSSDFRIDGSMAAAAVGNWTVSLNAQDRWWGPGWDGSIILSNNARPVPAVSLDRTFTDAFETRWLSWLGPWDLNVTMGQLESDRAIPSALLFGMRFNFRPLPSLEIGLSRTAQWCGDGRDCDSSTFLKMLIGQDNRGDDGLDASTEPGNQLAGVDFRWSGYGRGLPLAAYGQFIGEDEAGGLPSRFLGQVGVEMTGSWGERWSLRGFAEFSGTSCQFYESSERFNCAYNHEVYATGYRYRGRPIGHGADNDARVYSVGVLMADDAETEWRLLLRQAQLNRGGAPDPANALTPVPRDLTSIDLYHRRAFWFGLIDIGLGYERQDAPGGSGSDDLRFHLGWRSGW